MWKHLLTLLPLALLLASCQETPAPTLTISPGNQTIAAGSAPIAFTATLTNSTATISWSLDPASGAGTLSSLTGGSTTYTPPASIASTTAVTLTATAGALSRQVILIVNPATDTTPPTVVSVSPATGATGVAADANIVITFSERMNQSATQSAYQSATTGIRPSDVTFSWNAEGTVLTINPNANLAYATGTSNAVVALNYAFSVTNTATDTAGNALSTLASNFKTLRDITRSFEMGDPSGAVISDGTVYSSQTFPLYVGDNLDNLVARSFLSFDLSGLPAGLTVSQIVSATLRVYQYPSFGTPFTDLLDCTVPPLVICTNLQLQHVAYGATLVASDFDTATLANIPLTGCSLIVGCADTAGQRQIEVTDAVRNDWANKAARGSLSQFRLKFARATDGDNTNDFAIMANQVSTERNFLEVNFLIP